MPERPDPPEPPSAPRIPPFPGDVPRKLLAPVAGADLADHGRTLHLRLADASSGCGFRAYARDSDPVVVIVHRPLGPAAQQSCPKESDGVTVRLDEPLGDRTVVDAATGQAVPVRRPF